MPSVAADHSQRAAVPFAADHAGFRMFRHHKADNVAAVIQYARGLGQNRLAGAAGVTQEAMSLPVFSSSTRQSRQAPAGFRSG